MYSSTNHISRKISSFAAQRVASVISGSFSKAATATPGPFFFPASSAVRTFWSPPSRSTQALSKATLEKPTGPRFYSRPSWYDQEDRSLRSDSSSRLSNVFNFFSRFSMHPAVAALLAANLGVGFLWVVRHRWSLLEMVYAYSCQDVWKYAVRAEGSAEQCTRTFDLLAIANWLL